MKINSINQTSFKGLLSEPKKTQNIGHHSQYGASVYTQNFEYHPFKDETDEQANAAIEDLNKSMYAMNNKKDFFPFGPQAYYIAIVNLGERLNITTNEYNEIANLNTSLYQDKSYLHYEKLNDEEKNKVIQKIV